MRVRDRHWWLSALWSVCLLLSSGLFAVWYVQHILPLDRALAIPPIRDAILAGVICFMLAVLAIYTALGALAARHRYHARLAAIHGDPNAIPISRLADELALRPNLPESLPFIATNRTARRAIIGTLLANIVFFTVFLIFIEVPVFRLLLAIFQFDPRAVRILTHQFPTPPLAFVIFIGLWPILTFFILRDELRGRNYLMRSITITSEGITCIPPWGAPRTLRWHDALLFEAACVLAPSRQNRFTSSLNHQFTGLLLCTLYGATNTVRWSQRISAPSTTADQFAPLASLVAQHTNLNPYTFDIPLQYLVQPEPSDNVQPREHLLRIAVCLAIIATCSAFIGSETISWVVAIGGISVAVLSLWSYYSPKGKESRREYLREQQLTPLLSPLPPLDASEEAIDENEEATDQEPEQHFDDPLYEMTVGSYPLFVFNQVFFALLGAAAVLFALGALATEFTSFHPLPGIRLHSLDPMQIFGLLLLLPAGILTIIVSIRARDTIVLADLTGVRKRWLLGNTFIPWGDVERIEVRLIAGRPTYYRVFGHGGHPAFAWPASPFQPSPKPQEPGATLTNPDDMAAIVSQRSGKPLTPGQSRAFPL